MSNKVSVETERRPALFWSLGAVPYGGAVFAIAVALCLSAAYIAGLVIWLGWWSVPFVGLYLIGVAGISLLVAGSGKTGIVPLLTAFVAPAFSVSMLAAIVRLIGLI